MKCFLLVFVLAFSSSTFAQSLSGDAELNKSVLDTIKVEGHAVNPDEAATLIVGKGRKDSLSAMWDSTGGAVGQRDKILTFAKTYLSEVVANTQTVVYFFGGPDVLYPILTLSKLRTLISVGIEEAGTLPSVEEASSYVDRVAKANNTYYRMSFFKTKDMQSNLGKFGTTTVICANLKVMGNTIVNVSYLSAPAKGVQVDYKGADNVLRTVYYFDQYLNNEPLAQKPEFSKFILSFGKFTGFLKGAMLFPHRPDFSSMNSLIVDHAKYVVQTETAIPYEQFSKEKGWNMKVYGKYSGSGLNSISGSQPALARAYKYPDGPTDFMFDYEFIHGIQAGTREEIK